MYSISAILNILSKIVLIPQILVPLSVYIEPTEFWAWYNTKAIVPVGISGVVISFIALIYALIDFESPKQSVILMIMHIIVAFLGWLWFWGLMSV